MKTKIFTFLILGLLFFTVPKLQAQNLLYDGDFSLTTKINNYGYLPPHEWCELKSDFVDADASVIDGVCYYKVNSSGYSTWEIQLMQGGFVLEEGHIYRLSFDVKADDNTSFGVFLGEDGGNWTSLIGYENYNQFATTEWQTIILEFKTPCIFAYHKLSFELGNIYTNMYFDNVILEDIGTYEHSIGILGSSLDGWIWDFDLETTNGVVYTLTNFSLNSGRVKFRQDDSWCKNWGGIDFPEGTASVYGPDIIVPNPGNYDITFNSETGEYSFTCVDNCLPYIGITGSAVPPNFEFGPDVNMTTSDGVTYTLKSYSFTDGGAKFRQDDIWDNNWGGNTFPNGTAAFNGEEIPVTAGTYTVTFNIENGDYSFSFTNIGILGSALNGWDDDINLTTNDGINYFTNDLTFTEGGVKFRAENSWDINWGGWDFPNGWGYQDGPDIYVPAGIYNVTFNRLTGEYSFKATNCPIAGIQCPYGIYMISESGMCGAYVNYPEVTAAPNCGGEGLIIEQIEGLPSGSFFPIGYTVNTFMLTNAEGNTAFCSFEILVYEFEPPIITVSSNQMETLWPPNHKMVLVPLDYTVTDNCDTDVQTEIYVFSNEPDDGISDGNTSPDWEIVDNHNILLRAERSATDSSDRQYFIYLFFNDDSYNYAFQQIIVKVPHDMGKPKKPVNPGNKTKSAEISTVEEYVPFMAKVWPNPSNSSFNLEVQSSSDELIIISVFDLSGRLATKLETSNKQFLRFGEDLNPGLYNVIVQQDNNLRNIKIIKQL